MNKKLSQHPIFLHTSDIADICRPLHHFDITYFCHVLIDNEGKFAALANNPAFGEFYLKNKCYNADIHMAADNQFGKFILWDTFEKTGDTKEMDDAAISFGVRHTFTIVEKDQQGKHFYHYATHLKNPAINQVYLSNYEILKLFISYFKEQISCYKKINYAYQLKFSLDKNVPGFMVEDKNNLFLLTEKRKRFISDISTNLDSKKMIHKENQNIISLSSQQSKCLELLFKGFSLKEIAKQLHLSPRTVEHYLEKIRKISGCRNNKELISYYINFPFSF